MKRTIFRQFVIQLRSTPNMRQWQRGHDVKNIIVGSSARIIIGGRLSLHISRIMLKEEYFRHFEYSFQHLVSVGYHPIFRYSPDILGSYNSSHITHCANMYQQIYCHIFIGNWLGGTDIIIDPVFAIIVGSRVREHYGIMCLTESINSLCQSL